MKSLKEQVEDLGISRPEDIDPEDDPFAKRDDGSDSDEAPSEAGITGREHYEEVPNSRLRKPEQPALGKQYTGAAVSRRTLFDDEGNTQAEFGVDDDGEKPTTEADSESVASSGERSDFTSDGSKKFEFEDDDESDGEIALNDVRAEVMLSQGGDVSEIDSDEAFGSGDEERFKKKGFTFRGSKKALATEDSAEEGNSDEDGALIWDTEDEAEVDSDQQMEFDVSATDSDAESQDVSGDNSTSASDSDLSPELSSKLPTDREELKALLASDAAAVASTLSASANDDAQKGKAVKQQYQTFDRLLDARIKLQKGLTAAKDISLTSASTSDISVAAQSAEKAALKLFGIIESIRHSIHEATTDSKKRKRPSPPTTSTSSNALWTRISNLEDQSLPYRRAILNKWSSKTRSANGLSAPRSQLDSGAHQDTISDILDAQTISENQKWNQSESYDDTAFYQSLLRDLISSRASLSQSQTTVSDIPLPTAPKQHRKGVDTKASKGRKVRYTVHEKLQSFAAEEDRGTWTESAKAEFFASLFGGQGIMLDENANEEMEVHEGEVLGEEGALRLFRS